MKDLGRVVLLAGAFIVLTIANIVWYETKARAESAVPAPGGVIANGPAYQNAQNTISGYRITFWAIEAGAFVICAGLLALPRKPA